MQSYTSRRALFVGNTNIFSTIETENNNTFGEVMMKILLYR